MNTITPYIEALAPLPIPKDIDTDTGSFCQLAADFATCFVHGHSLSDLSLEAVITAARQLPQTHEATRDSIVGRILQGNAITAGRRQIGAELRRLVFDLVAHGIMRGESGEVPLEPDKWVSLRWMQALTTIKDADADTLRHSARQGRIKSEKLGKVWWYSYRQFKQMLPHVHYKQSLTDADIEESEDTMMGEQEMARLLREAAGKDGK